jgi:SOS response regulatory protein OraA/RecX
MPLALRKWNSTSGTRVDKKRKTMGLLLRRGYTQSLVRRVIAQLQQTTEFDEDFSDME